jgi:hypothetical protein
MKRPKFVWTPKQTRKTRLLRFYTNDNDMKWYNLRLRKIVEMFRREWALGSWNPTILLTVKTGGRLYFFSVANQDPPTTDPGDGDPFCCLASL